MQSQCKIRIVLTLLVASAAWALAAVYARAQAVPPTARQAAELPQFAARLAHPPASQQKTPARRRAGFCGPVRGSGQEDNFPLQDLLYSNGPVNGTTDAWDINFGFVVADTFIVPNGGGSPGEISFGAWLFPGDVLQSVEISITSMPFGGTVYMDAVVAFTQGSCSSNQYGFNVCSEVGAMPGPSLSAGTYWLNFQNAVVNDGNPAYWDENSGPSAASESSVGTIPSEAFTLDNGGNVCMPEQSGGFKVIHDFNGTDGANPSGVAIDAFGSLFGVSQPTGGHGSIYKIAQTAVGWSLTNLYRFMGGDDGNTPTGVIVGNHGILYGAAAGGIQACTPGACGLIFDLTPSPAACTTALCSWTEKVLYGFTGPTDAWQGGNLVSDQAGNLYGVSYSGGAQQRGAVFELRPSIGGWVESILYSFTGASDGGNPTDIIVGNDGKLYGMAAQGGTGGGGVVFQLASSGGGWTETVLYNIPSTQLGTSPHSLLQDTSGNLYGIYNYDGCCYSSVGLIFMLSPSGGNWVFTELHHGDPNLDGDDEFPNMTLDAAGNLRGTESAYNGCINPVDYGSIFELARTGNGWQFSAPVSWSHTYFPTGGPLAIDAHGNLYGTTSGCGGNQQGTVWEFSP